MTGLFCVCASVCSNDSKTSATLTWITARNKDFIDLKLQILDLHRFDRIS